MRLHLFLLALTTACSAPDVNLPLTADAGDDVPPLEIVSRIEAQLLHHACVGRLDRWARFYRWQPLREDFDGARTSTNGNRRQKVQVILREAGRFGYRAGTFIEPSPPPLKPGEVYMEVDDRDYLVAAGWYDVRTSGFTLESCGRNVNNL